MSLNVKEEVKKGYSKIAQGNCSCSCQNKKIAASIGYNNEDIEELDNANLGLGCGNPVALSNMKVGDTVLDLGSGAGFDAFLAARRVGATGKVIGVDMTPEMVKMADANAKKYNYNNTEFKLGEIEKLPIEDNSIDVIISNCVINLSPDKLTVFKEASRVLKDSGKMYVSDIVLLSDLSEEQLNDQELLVGCVAGALLKEDYLNIIKQAGLKVNILSEDKEISKRQYQGVDLESLKIEVYK